MDTLSLSKITVDTEQPRKHFDAEKMRSLKDSIKREGIISPLIVEKVGNGYLLIDGERRFRAATELKLDKVPVVIEEARSGVDRLVRQFTVQEQHEAWTPIEKANALLKLSEEIGLSLGEVCKLVNVSHRDTSRYVAFAELVDKGAWLRSEIPLGMVPYVKSARNAAKRAFESLEQEFNRSTEKKLEHRFIHEMVSGTITHRGDFTKLGASFQKDPKSAEAYINDPKMTSTALFLKTGARGAVALRNIMYSTSYITTHGRTFMEHPDVKISATQVNAMKIAKETLTKLIDMA